MRVAVTGAAGFVGSALVSKLEAAGHNVMPLSREDIHDADFSGVETVVHCAALAHRTGAERPDAKTFDAVNHRLAVELARKAKAQGVRRFVFVSTIYTIAGNPSPLAPDMPLAPRDDYGRAKARAEAALLAMTGLDIVIARPVLVYGPGARANLKALMKLCDSRIPLPFGAANNKRSFVSLENVARALIFLSEAPAEKVAGRVFHLAEPQPRSTREIVGKARAAMQRPARLVPVPPLIMKFLLGGIGKRGLYDQLFGNLVADSSLLIEAGFEYLPGDPQLELMARAAKDS
ncbi:MULTISPECIES: NAD-dependent epimerase/dehydratase family protein [Brucella]|uniref:UDP-glucose 4-epimerase n=3 Tax=Brucella melitensis TaxID=29459 RepID=C0RI56_BRUMB|nr:MULTISPECIES: NAD-dependent epimerase/dehydratase family protein [Brucella]AAL52418.1 udp-glucose 4-epimerase [Brucella melitensis bv. 1 str. 16M]ACO00514.1 UDP-glucose 4-epimerase [Brucella melitensis ATCC 23457]ADZ65801.1 UDP-glucose 4-epimerase [Brucella melitensis M28]ADZ86671.1 UDP-glucose 4-epimerase [Brucella melitensis M5-90]AEQ08338.1 UDP-glucose 4-epimerase [Brucella melitensis NI]